MAGYGRLEKKDLLEGLDLWLMEKTGLIRIINDFRETGRHGMYANFWMILVTIIFSPLYVLGIIGPFVSGEDLEEFTGLMINPLTGIQICLKFWVLWFRIEPLCQLTELFKKDFLNGFPPEKRQRAMTMMHATCEKATAIAKLCFWVNSVVVATWNILPILRSEVFREQLGISFLGKAEGHNKIMVFWYPGKMDETPNVQIIYGYEFFCCTMGGMLISMVEAISAQFMVLLTGRIEVLKYLLIEEETQRVPKSFEEEEATIMISLNEHQYLMRAGQLMADLYNLPVTVLIVTGQLILIIGIYNFFMNSGKGDLIMMLKFTIYAMYTFVEVTIYCILGDNLEFESSDVRNAAYCSGWHRRVPALRKNLVFLMMRTHRTLALTAGQLYHVNIAVLTNLIQMAYSTSMFMYRISKKEVDAE